MEEFLFPHEKIREVQEDFIRDVAKSLEEKKNMVIHAPTGLGKTTILGPALAYAIKNKKTAFFITPRHTQHKIAIETLKKIKEKHKTNFVAVDIIGKKWMCQQTGVKELTTGEFGEYCRELIENGNCEYYANVRKKGKASMETELLLRELKEKNPVDVEEMCKRCREAKLCPYEIACMLGQEARVIIGDYFHVLSPAIRENLFGKMNKDLSESILIFDEGHNIPARARDLLTSTITSLSLENAAKECRSLGHYELAGGVEKMREALERFVREKTDMENDEALIEKNEFYEEVGKIGDYEQMNGSLSFVAETILETKKRSSAHSLATFMENWLGPDEGFARILAKGFTKQGKGVITLSYRCLDPSMIIKPIADQATIITMSGTLTPTSMYKDLFGIEAETREYRDVFPKHNRLNLIIPKTTTRYTERNSEMYNKIAIVAAKLSNAIPGNAAIFFPSYKVLDCVKNYLNEYSEKTTFTEMQGMNKTERQEMIEKFKSYKDSGAILLGCSSGSFGEGVDLPGEYLKGVIVVGLPLSKPDLETKKLIEYYDKKFGKGWDYGYVYPAILKVIQNAGRCIRSKTDKGVRIFVDERYAWQSYMRCFPKDWEMKTTNMPITAIGEFFNTGISLNTK